MKNSVTLSQIAEKINQCRRCDLWKTKRNYVPGEGSCHSKVVFVGEAPGREEDLQGRPFVGNAGKLLTELIDKKLGLRRDEVFITNVLKCRPPENRDPLPEEVRECSPFLFEQLEVLKPEVLVCLGRHSASLIFSLYQLDFPGISAVRGKIFEKDTEWGKLRLIAIYHPAAALYKPPLRGILERDFEKIASLISGDDKSNGKAIERKLNDFFEI
jgi:DNA polymerase